MTIKNFSLCTITGLLTLSLCSICVQAQETIAEIDFDTNEAKYQYGYAFGGYGPADGSDSVAIGDSMKVEQSIDAKGGVFFGRTSLEAEMKNLTERLGDAHPDVKSLKKRIELISGEAAAQGNACAKAVLDSSAAEVPSDSSYDYAGFATGAAFDMTDKELPKIDAETAVVSFDAKVVGTDSLQQSKLMVNFLIADGDDAGENDDIVLRLTRGTPEGDDTFELNSEYQNFSFKLSELEIEEGSFEALKDAKLIAIGFTVQAQGSVSDIGSDADNVLMVDNIKLIAN